MANQTQLEAAIAAQEKLSRAALDRIRWLASDETENEVHDLAISLLHTVELLGCLRRMVPGRTLADIHAAFGAPGDFGYYTPIGAALAKLYRGEGDSAAEGSPPP